MGESFTFLEEAGWSQRWNALDPAHERKWCVYTLPYKVYLPNSLTHTYHSERRFELLGNLEVGGESEQRGRSHSNTAIVSAEEGKC